ncbi:MAG: N-acetylglucosamine-6-phosphate deacetylase [Planctomycetes bacterium]|nr:N-acetylglucosamine-6-phosphate deacetylase [Planctomycetota bacterium]
METVAVGRVTLPGFVDLQVNGFVGVDFSDAALTAEAFRRACRELLKRGTAAFLPTVITSPLQRLERNLALMAPILAEDEFAGRLLGFHVEGPFISSAPGAVGAHDVASVRHPSVELFDRLQQAAGGKIRLITIAAEVPGAERFARHAEAAGVTVSLGHQMAGQADLLRLVAAGATALTHLGNGLPEMIHRHHNPIWEGLANDDLTVMMIADGHHLPESMLRVYLRAKGPGRIVVVSDAAPIAGFPPGIYQTLGNTVVLEPSGLLRNPEKGCMVGSSATLLDCMNHLASLDVLDLDGLRQVGFANPLALIGLTADDVDTTETLRYDPVARRFDLRG